MPPPPFPLPPGATGFFPPHAPLPETDPRTFRTALYTAARAARGRVDEVEDHVHPRTYRTGTVIHPAGRTVVLGHLHHPWIAFVPERRDAYADEFLSPPPWADVFSAAGFLVLTGDQLSVPLAGEASSGLTPFEWRQAVYHGTATLGGAVFNTWD
ncbi:hypothetical protein [Streptomyces sp. T028]|uniref:hypothetical protein n=1 Tax=Streptomyces sp. T028 TaxID=3394379 RepID=UPI003A882DF6